jgi:hypothetical protein
LWQSRRLTALFKESRPRLVHRAFGRASAKEFKHDLSLLQDKKWPGLLGVILATSSSFPVIGKAFTVEADEFSKRI